MIVDEEALAGDIEPPIGPTHPMITRARDGIKKPNLKYTLQISTTPMVLTTMTVALGNPLWRQAMDDEMKAITKNSTWRLVQCDGLMNLLSCKWVYK